MLVSEIKAELASLKWKHRSTNDSEYSDARYKCFDIQIQDCDGDFSRWHIKRGKQYVAVGETYGETGVYHMDHAQKIALDVLEHLIRAVDLNDFVANELPKLSSRSET